ncbi:hypothetical protein ACH5RR_004298 [Cinchona calisaya]|uniref:Uncharacterized protein n=1 Tax=Cinchona calisaya TaxID=153742 RepID=A0ABD3AX58_9GENT
MLMLRDNTGVVSLRTKYMLNNVVRKIHAWSMQHKISLSGFHTLCLVCMDQEFTMVWCFLLYFYTGWLDRCIHCQSKIEMGTPKNSAEGVHNNRPGGLKLVHGRA